MNRSFRVWDGLRGPREAMARRLTLAALALAAASGCTPAVAPVGADDLSMESSLPDLTVPPPDQSGSDLKDNDYPAGPYAQSGNPNVGEVLPDFTFQGYWSPKATTGLANANGIPFGEITMGMLHRCGAKYAILNLSAFW